MLRLVEGLRAGGHEAILLARAEAPLLGEALRRGFDACPLSWRSLLEQRHKAAVIHAHDARSHTMAAMAGCKPLVVSRRVAFPVARHALSRWKYARAAHYIAVSQFVKQTLLDAGIEASRISVVYDGVPMQPVSRGSEILVPASADPRKGTDMAVAGAKLAGLNPLLSQDLERDLARAGMFLYITESEGLGSAVLLAMAAGVPVIASRTGGLPEIVEHERTGLLADNSAESIARAIRRLQENRSLAQMLAAQARQAVAERFSAERMVCGTAAVYEALH